MSVPKKKLSKRRVRARRSHHGVSTVHSIKSPVPGDDSYIRPHHGHEYNGKWYSWKELKKLMGGLKKREELKEAKAEDSKEAKAEKSAEAKKPAAKKAPKAEAATEPAKEEKAEKKK